MLGCWLCVILFVFGLVFWVFVWGCVVVLGVFCVFLIVVGLGVLVVVCSFWLLWWGVFGVVVLFGVVMVLFGVVMVFFVWCLLSQGDLKCVLDSMCPSAQGRDLERLNILFECSIAATGRESL